MSAFWRTRGQTIGALAVTAAILGACATPHLEVAANPSQPVVTLTQAGVRLTLVLQDWHSFPSDLPEYYTPIRIQIRNDRNDEVDVRRQDFAALDAAGNQYAAVQPTEVAQALTRVAANAAAADWALADGDGWRNWWTLGPRYDSFYYPWYPSFTDVLRLSLQDGSVLPGARVQGFLYLQPISRRGPLTLVWTPRLASGQSLPQFNVRLRVAR